MVAVSLRMNKSGKSSVVRLVSYLLDHQGNEDRVRSWRITNCLDAIDSPVYDFQEDDVRLAASQMLWTQKQNTRAKSDKTYHLVLSFREEPDQHTLKKIEAEFCAALGFQENERISVLHGDTENFHLHIVVNKVHPKTHRLISPFHDHRILAETCRRMEQSCLLQPDRHDFAGQAKSNAADRMEACADMESLTGWIRRNLGEKLEKAESWDQFHACLLESGLTFRLHGNGCVFAGEGIFVKASAVNRLFSKRSLEQKFGPFQAASASAAKTEKMAYCKKPMKHFVSSDVLWAEYKEYCKSQEERKKTELLRLDEEFRTELHRRFGTTLSEIAAELFVDDSNLRRILRAINAAGRKHEAKMLRKEYEAKRRSIRADCRRLSWEKWLNSLAMAGREDALMLIRSRAFLMPQNSIIMDDAVHDSPAVKITRKGTQIFSDGMREYKGCWQARRSLDMDEFLKRNAERPLSINGSEIFKNQVFSMYKRSGKKPTFLQPQIAQEWAQATSPTYGWRTPSIYQGR